MIIDNFFISPLNPIGFSEVRPDLYYEFNHNPYCCYAQKFENGDQTRFQMMSKEIVDSVILRRASDNKVISSLPFENIGTANFSDEPFSFGFNPDDYRLYESVIDFDSIDEDYYYIEIETSSNEKYFSDLMQVSPKWEDTLWIEYRNSTDHDGIKFRDDDLFGIRVEGTVREFQPSAEDNVYFDDPHNPHTLSSRPYRNFTLFVGGKNGMPDYMSDIVNRVMTTDHVYIDGDRFNKNDESEWEVQRDPEIPFQSMSMSVQSVDPVMQFSFREPIKPIYIDLGDWVLFRRSHNVSKSSDFTVKNVIKDKTTLEYITIYGNGITPYELKVGTTEGGDEILTTVISEPIETLHLRENFADDTTLYFSGVTEMQDFHIVYEILNKKGGQYDDNNNSNNGDLPIGVILLYGKTPQELSGDFDINTGMGRNNSPFKGWAICDGRNGTFDYTDSVPYGWDQKTGQIGDVEGSNMVKIQESELPVITPKWRWSEGMRNDTFKGRDGTIYVDMQTANKPSNDAPIEQEPIQPFGGGADFDLRSQRVISLFIQKIS